MNKVEYIDGLRNSIYLLYNNYLYTKGNSNYWKCRHPDCNRLIKVIDDIVLNEPDHPMHTEVSEVEIECLKAIKSMKTEAVLDRHTDYRIIYDRNIKKLTDKNFKLADIAQFISPFPAFRGTLVKCREKNKTAVPKSIDALNIQGDHRLTNEKLPFLAYDNLNNEHRIIVFMSDFAMEWLRTCLSIHGDGTFKECPSLFFQFYVIFAERSNFIVPCVFAILPDKTTETYVELLTAVKDKIRPVNDLVSKPLNPVFALTDFESSMQNALIYCFPSIQLKGCYFHLKQAVYHWCHRKGYKKEYVAIFSYDSIECIW